MATTKLSQSAIRRIEQGEEVLLYSAAAVTLAAAAVYETPSSGSVATTPTAGMWIERGQERQVVIAGIGDAAGAANGVVVEEAMTDQETNLVSAPFPDQDGAFTPAADKLVRGVHNLSARFYRFAWTNGAAEAVVDIDVRVRR